MRFIIDFLSLIPYNKLCCLNCTRSSVDRALVSGTKRGGSIPSGCTIHNRADCLTYITGPRFFF